MRGFGSAVGLLALGLLAAGAWWWWQRSPAAPAPPAAAVAPAPAPREAAPQAPGPAAQPAPAPEAVPAPEPGPAPAAAGHADEDAAPEEPADPTGDLALYSQRPLSAVPHSVQRGWGAGGGSRHPGYVTLQVVVEPGLSDAELEKLARDIRDYHASARSLSVVILDSQEAATYDRHLDGGERAEEHTVATVNRDEKLETDSIVVRGRELVSD